MVDEREIWACAHQLLRQHGEGAWFVAAQRADELLAQGEINGHFTFLKILDRIRQLTDRPPDGALH